MATGGSAGYAFPGPLGRYFFLLLIAVRKFTTLTARLDHRNRRVGSPKAGPALRLRWSSLAAARPELAGIMVNFLAVTNIPPRPCWVGTRPGVPSRRHGMP